ncbi:hypothetical protein H310_10236 [Aphanomyces invadans]|uniref:Uncharacterized protein n=1 Tax=Aphanomyces invadans TaxID=157072 RepID=A0A024TT84_9STRA|nr:hypothetical protein H310_10236 [Aphanomyces invadans]ETV96517.1 hypothetical protein H310_10236 [Aphanomyces invadans]RHY29546.1 hypothetical protein DYB32_005064 [Aphanomyces invadans]|eukprot:XP_008874780.1 hypothetical protein H310_10236 [Aphanomyces invadans]
MGEALSHLTFRFIHSTDMASTETNASSPPPPMSPSSAPREDQRCKYPYKACFHPRSIKKDGEAHSLCEFHRKKANSIQKIYATKRRQQLRALKKLKILQHKHRPDEFDVTALPAPLPLSHIHNDDQSDVDRIRSLPDHSSLPYEDAVFHARLQHQRRLNESALPISSVASRRPCLYDMNFLLNHA